MSACEQCWSQANHRALMRGGSVVDHYRDLLVEFDGIHTTEGGPADVTRCMSHPGGNLTEESTE